MIHQVVNTVQINADIASKVPLTRTISTTAPLTGGGDLSADRTIAIPQASQATNGYLSSADFGVFSEKADGSVYFYDASDDGYAQIGNSVESISINSASGGLVLIEYDDVTLFGSVVAIAAPNTNISSSVYITPQTAASKPLLIRGATSQSANFLEIQKSDGTPLSYWDSNAQLIMRPVVPGNPVLQTALGEIWCFGQGVSPRFLFGQNSGICGGFTWNHAASRLGISGDAVTEAVSILRSNNCVGINNTSPVAQFDVTIGSSSRVGEIFKTAASQSVDIKQITNSSNAVLERVNKDGYRVIKKTSAPADADLSASEVTLWFDATANKLMVKAKNSSGTVKTGELVLS